MELIQRDILPKIINRLERREIIAIRGPRRAGKSTLLMQIKEFLVSSGIDEKNIIYYAFDDPEIIDSFVNDPVRFFQVQIRNKERYYFLLDEVQYDKLAGKHLKLAFDSIKDIKIIITGSSSLDIAQVSKFLVGRVLLYDLDTLSSVNILDTMMRNCTVFLMAICPDFGTS